jgi:AcrR family transcriptional regulator
VNERTVYRHFGSERELRDAVMERLIEEAGVELDELAVDSFADHVTDVYHYLSSFTVARGKESDPTFSAIDRRRRGALLDAVESAIPDWSPTDRRTVAGVLDVLWNVPTYARLLGAWDLDADEAARAAAWVIALVQRAIEEDHRPSS